jgi:DNA-binding NarL/FixJ family response regulator
MRVRRIDGGSIGPTTVVTLVIAQRGRANDDAGVTESQRTGDALKTLLVVDAEGALFSRIGTLELGVPMWRTTRDPLELGLDGSTLIVLDADQAPSWERVYEWIRRGPTVVATRRPTIPNALDALHAGALGYVDVAADDEAVARTLRGALRGEAAFARSVLGVWLQYQRQPEVPTMAARLTERQRQVVQLIATGSTDREIALRLGIRQATAQKHVANTLRRLHVRNRAEAVGVILTDPFRTGPSIDRIGDGDEPRIRGPRAS